MKVTRYQTIQLDEFTYKFYSDGSRGLFELRVIISKVQNRQNSEFYNLAFGVWDAIAGIIDDTIEIRNGDMDQILATVAGAALNFLDLHPKGWLYAEGSNLVRTRKYQMGIAKYLHEIEENFQIRGLLWDADREEWDWERFRLGTNYYGFVLFVE